MMTSSGQASRRLAQIVELDAKLGAFRAIFDQPLQHRQDGPLAGLTFAIKDALKVKGEVAGVGSRVVGGRRADANAETVERLLEAGASALGAAQLVELAFGGWGTNRAVGTPVNPWSGEFPLSPGGSSSGSAVAVASGMVDFALGTDTGGSVRIPAAFCGVTGLRPSPNTIPTGGLVHVSPTLDTIGPLARSAELCAKVFAVLSGTFPTDRRLLADLTGVRLALPTAPSMTHVRADIRASFEQAVHTLVTLGAVLTPHRIAIDFAGDQATAGAIIGYEAYGAFGEMVMREFSQMDPAVVRRVLVGKDISQAAYDEALRVRGDLVSGWSKRFTEFDLFVLPTLPIPAARIETVDESDLSPSLLTRFVGLADLCALSVPMAPSADGLPAGLQLVAANGADQQLLAAGIAFQSVTDWHRMEPPAFLGS